MLAAGRGGGGADTRPRAARPGLGRAVGLGAEQVAHDSELRDGRGPQPAAPRRAGRAAAAGWSRRSCGGSTGRSPRADALHRAYADAGALDHARRALARVGCPLDARAAWPVEPESLSLVLTSPPYFNAVDYPRGHRLAVCWMQPWTRPDLNGTADAWLKTRRPYVGLRHAGGAGGRRLVREPAGDPKGRPVGGPTPRQVGRPAVRVLRRPVGRAGPVARGPRGRAGTPRSSSATTSSAGRACRWAGRWDCSLAR